jgi:BMFP domain-containing protein YqiC
MRRMMDTKILTQIAEKLGDILPVDLQEVKTDLQKHFREILQVQFAKLDLVTREEFDVQQKVLLRSREKLEALARKIEALEKK